MSSDILLHKNNSYGSGEKAWRVLPGPFDLPVRPSERYCLTQMALPVGQITDQSNLCWSLYIWWKWYPAYLCSAKRMCSFVFQADGETPKGKTKFRRGFYLCFILTPESWFRTLREVCLSNSVLFPVDGTHLLIPTLGNTYAQWIFSL